MAKLNAFLSEYSGINGDELHTLSATELANGLSFSVHDFSSNPSYVLVGHADIAVTLLPRAEVIGTHIATLRAKQQKIMADAQAESIDLDRKINSLLAIEGAATVVSA